MKTLKDLALDGDLLAVAELIAQLEAAEKDVKRYRFIGADLLSRYNPSDKSYCLYWDHRGKCSGESDEWPDIDFIIDAAINEKPE